MHILTRKFNGRHHAA